MDLFSSHFKAIYIFTHFFKDCSCIKIIHSKFWIKFYMRNVVVHTSSVLQKCDGQEFFGCLVELSNQSTSRAIVTVRLLGWGGGGLDLNRLCICLYVLFYEPQNSRGLTQPRNPPLATNLTSWVFKTDI